MFQNRPFLFLGLAAGIALFTTVLIYNWLQGQQAPPSVEAQEVPVATSGVAVSSADVPWGTQLDKDMIRLVQVPEADRPDGHFATPEELEGRIVLTNLKRNEPILESKLAPTTIKSGGVAAVMNPENRAMAVRVDEVVGLPGFVKPGDRVDVMVTIMNLKRKEKATKVILENVLVLATGTEMERKGPDDEPEPVKVITLEVTLEEAEKLAFATNEGQLRLALRSPLNSEPKMTKGATYKSLLTSYKAKKAAARQKRRQRVEVVKGSEKSVARF